MELLRRLRRITTLTNEVKNMKKKNQKPQIPLRKWHQLKDGTVIDHAYYDCIHYYRRDGITNGRSCHSFCIDSECVEETEGKPCCLIQYAPGYKSDKIRYIYFKISENEQKAIENKLKGCPCTATT